MPGRPLLSLALLYPAALTLAPLCSPWLPPLITTVFCPSRLGSDIRVSRNTCILMVELTAGTIVAVRVDFRVCFQFFSAFRMKCFRLFLVNSILTILTEAMHIEVWLFLWLSGDFVSPGAYLICFSIYFCPICHTNPYTWGNRLLCSILSRLSLHHIQLALTRSTTSKTTTHLQI